MPHPLITHFRTFSLFYAGLIFLANVLFPPTTRLNGGGDTGRAWLGSDRKSIATTVSNGPGKWITQKQDVYVQVDLTRLVVSESFILGGLLVGLGIAADAGQKKKP